MQTKSRKKMLLGHSRLALFVVCLVNAGASPCLELIDLEASGPVARDIDELFWTTVALMSLVLVPVLTMTGWFAWKYRAGNGRAPYAPEWDRSFWLECLVWFVPGLIITVLAGMTWIFSHRLDPYQPLPSDKPPLEIQVVALDWKWLFIYPQQNIAAVNELYFPVGRPLHFKITSATVMNSFFIPRLGGQIYAMAGMQTQLHLIADKPGHYFGENTQFSGRGFPYQHFLAVATATKNFTAWVEQAKRSPQHLDRDSLDELAQPSIRHPVSYYGSVTPGLFEHVIAAFGTAKSNALSSPNNPYGARPNVR